MFRLFAAYVARRQSCRVAYCRRWLSDNNNSEVIVEKDIAIPVYRARENEPVEVLRARLLYQSRKRGMLENGLLLSTFADKHLDNMEHSQLVQYDKLINQPNNDWTIYYWITGREAIPVEYDNEVMTMLRDHVRNDKREHRYRQPDLKQPIKQT